MTRHMSAEEASALGVGSDHYRAYVGPPERFGPLTLLQMGLLAALGLEETDQVLDFGCGSLRLGRSLIPFLRRGGYHGVDPNMWLMDDGLRAETGVELATVKAPAFSGDANFDCRVFGTRYDFIMAQSIITHSGPAQTARLFQTAGEALAEDGIVLLSYIRAESGAPLPEADWTYPANVAYPDDWLTETARSAGLVWQAIDWHHPGASWAAMARDARRLPEPGAALGCQGAPLPRWRAGA